MKKQYIYTIFIFFLIFLYADTLYAAVNFSPCSKFFQHDIQLQLSDANGFPVPDTEFWVTLNIFKEGPRVTIQFPVINFQTGQVSPDDPGVPLVPGGYLYTSDGYLPKEIRPNDLVPLSFLAPSDNGLSLPFSFTQTPATLPVPPSGYILQVTQAGALQVQGVGTFGNVIPPGKQIIFPTAISYLVQFDDALQKNYVLSTGATNITQFTNPFFADHGFRDSHVNDAFNSVLAWAWADNSNIRDKTNNTLNAMVVIGSVNGNSLVFSKPIQLTNLLPNQMVWDTAVAINRTNSSNIVVSFQVIDATVPSPRPDITPVRVPWRSVSFDGGVTWETGPILNIVEPRGGAIISGDNRGVSSDMFGNIWYLTTQFFDASFNTINQPIFAVSTDGGVTFNVVFIAPPVMNVSDLYDYPQYCFGGFGDDGQYGLWFTADYFTGGNIIPFVGFIPITETGIGMGITAFLNKLINTQLLPTITASEDGRVWVESLTEAGATYIAPVVTRFKSPDGIDANYAGPWDMGYVNQLDTDLLANQISFPKRGYIPASVQSNIYDESRKALYAMYAAQVPDYAQNMQIFFVISRDNGMTWSQPIQIATTNFANRGYQSMALDSVTRNLVFGWYDGRNDISYQSVEYFAAVITAEQLDRIVNRIALTDPLFEVPSAA